MRAIAASVLASLVTVACGSGGSDSADVTSTGPPPPSESADPPESSVPGSSSTVPGSIPDSDPDPVPAGVAIPVSDGVGRASVQSDAPVADLVEGWNDAGFDLLRRLPPEENVVFSPASIGHALLIAAAAGDDQTRSAIESAFGLPQGAHDAWNDIDHQITASQSEQVTVAIADRIWPRDGVVPDQEWVDLIASHHGGDVVPLDYAEPVESQRAINDWVSDRTSGLIPEVLSAPPAPETVMVLTDAVYFAADWALPFGKYRPVNGPFTTFDGTEVNLPFMRELELADRRGVGEGFVGAEIPYVGDEYSMLVLVPDAGRYEELVERLDQDVLDEIDATFTTGPYELLLPQWSDDHQLDLADWLTELGVAPGAFPAIAPGAFLDTAVHAADITVDERGTVAAAATALGFAMSGPPEPELTVAADRPFVYLIRHRTSGLVLFAGHTTDPTA
jgi:serpin B